MKKESPGLALPAPRLLNVYALAAALFCALCLCLAPAPLFCRVVDGNVIMNQRMEENLCALTFDDGPSPSTPLLLDMLRASGIPATFFLLGENAEHYPDLVRRMAREGHEIGNHTYSHPNLRLLGLAAKNQQIRETDRILRDLGASPLYMRPPYGSFDSDVTAIAEDLGLSVILWSLDSRDWKKLPENYAALRSTRGTVYEEGSLRGVFLFHDTHRSTVEDLPRILAQLRAGGCERFVTISEYLRGIPDLEPAQRMTRRKPGQDETIMPSYAAGTGPLPFARSSKPWRLSTLPGPGATVMMAH